jgi:hypothetical protein
MANSPSAAASIYPNLAHDDGRVADWVTQRRDRNDVAGAVYGHLRPPPPKPVPARRESTTDLAAACAPDAGAQNELCVQLSS